MVRHPHTRVVTLMRFAVVIVSLTSMSLPWSLETATPVHADDPEQRDHRGEEQPQLPPPSPSGRPGIVHDHRDPDARLEIIIKSIKVHDDGESRLEWDGGEFWLGVELYRVRPGCATALSGEGCGILRLSRRDIAFEADTDDTVILNQSISDKGSGHDASIGPETGIPVWADQKYQLTIYGHEMDLQFHDDVGKLNVVLTAEDNWHIGTYTERGERVDGGPLGNEFVVRPAHLSVEYEVRLMPLPDLVPTRVEQVDVAGSPNDAVCMDVRNNGPAAAGPFQMTVLVDDAVVPNGIVEAGKLPAGQVGTLCTETTLPTSGEWLSVIVDDDRIVLEQHERNNRLDRRYGFNYSSVPSVSLPPGVFTSGPGANVSPAAAGAVVIDPRPAASPTPGPAAAPSQARPDLTVSAIRVNGRVPDGKDDCKDGKNDVSVVVKNAGIANADAFVVRLQVDGAEDQTAEKSLPGLDAGQEREVRFDGVRLKKGERKLAATADAGKAVAESNEGNNSHEVVARCDDD